MPLYSRKVKTFQRLWTFLFPVLQNSYQNPNKVWVKFLAGIQYAWSTLDGEFSRGMWVERIFNLSIIAVSTGQQNNTFQFVVDTSFSEKFSATP